MSNISINYGLMDDDQSVSGLIIRRKKPVGDESIGKVELIHQAGEDVTISNACVVLNHLIATIGFEAFYEGQKQFVEALGIDTSSIDGVDNGS